MEGASSILTQLRSMVEEAMDEFRVPGVALGLLRNGSDHMLSFGVTNVDHPLPVDEGTLFQIGSTAKTVTATAALRLVDRGALSLDDPVRTWLADLRLADEDVAATLTLRHLLTHSAGFEGELIGDFGDGDDALARFTERLADAAQLAPPGVWGYQNTAFMLLGRIIEVVTGTTYENAVRELVLEPLQMTQTFFSANEAITHRVSVGHRIKDGGAKVTEPWDLPRAMRPAGGLASTVRDQLRYARFHIGDGSVGDGTRLLSAATMRLMQTPQVKAGGGYADWVGLAWLIQRTPGVIAHGGSTNGQESAFVIVPSREFALTILTNSDTGAALHRRITKWTLRNILKLKPGRPSFEPTSSVEAYVGCYRGQLHEVDVRSEPKSNGVVMVISPSSMLLSLAPDNEIERDVPAMVFDNDGFKIAQGRMAGTHGEFIRDDDGHVRYLRLNGRLLQRT